MEKAAAGEEGLAQNSSQTSQYIALQLTDSIKENTFRAFTASAEQNIYIGALPKSPLK